MRPLVGPRCSWAQRLAIYLIGNLNCNLNLSGDLNWNLGGSLSCNLSGDPSCNLSGNLALAPASPSSSPTRTISTTPRPTPWPPPSPPPYASWRSRTSVTPTATSVVGATTTCTRTGSWRRRLPGCAPPCPPPEVLSPRQPLAARLTAAAAAVAGGDQLDQVAVRGPGQALSGGG